MKYWVKFTIWLTVSVVMRLIVDSLNASNYWVWFTGYLSGIGAMGLNLFSFSHPTTEGEEE